MCVLEGQFKDLDPVLKENDSTIPRLSCCYKAKICSVSSSEDQFFNPEQSHLAKLSFHQMTGSRSLTRWALDRFQVDSLWCESKQTDLRITTFLTRQRGILPHLCRSERLRVRPPERGPRHKHQETPEADNSAC